MGYAYGYGYGVDRRSLAALVGGGGGVMGPAIQALFDENRYSRFGEQKPMADVFMITSGAGYAHDSEHYMARFPANVPRVTDIGLTLEAEAINRLGYSLDLTTGWTGNSMTISSALGPDGLTYWRSYADASAVGLLARTCTLSGTIPNNSARHTASFYFLKDAAATGNFQVQLRLQGGTQVEGRANFDPRTGVFTAKNAAAFNAVVEDRGWYFRATITVANNNTGNTTAVLTVKMAAQAAGSTSTAESVAAMGSGSFMGAQLENGDVATSLIETQGVLPVTRPADVGKLRIGATPRNIILTYSDGSTQTLSGVSGDYTLPIPAAGIRIRSAISDDRPAVTWPNPIFMIADYVEGGAGTDNAGELLAALRTAEADGDLTLRDGLYGVDHSVRFIKPDLNDFEFNGPATLIFRNPTPETGGQLAVGTPNRSGDKLTIQHLTMRHDRATVRTGNVDLLAVRGMDEYHLAHNWLLSADNMALTVGRGDPNTTIPTAVYIGYNHFGGYVSPDGLDSHGTVGDSEIWVLTPGLNTVIEYNYGEMCGDDFIFLGHNTSATECDIEIRFNTGINVSGGISTSFHHVKVLDNYICGTLNVGIGFITDSELGNAYVAHYGVSARNTVEEAGFFTAADANGDANIGQANPFPFWFRGNHITSTDDVARRSKGRAICIQPVNGTTMTDLHIEGFLAERIGCSDKSGTLSPWSPTNEIVHRSASTTGNFQDGEFGTAEKPIRVKDTKQSLVGWFFPSNGTAVDTDIVMYFEVENYDIGSNPAVNVAAPGVSSTAKVTMTVNIRVLDSSVISNPKAVSGGATSPGDVTVNITYG